MSVISDTVKYWYAPSKYRFKNNTWSHQVGFENVFSKQIPCDPQYSSILLDFLKHYPFYGMSQQCQVYQGSKQINCFKLKIRKVFNMDCTFFYLLCHKISLICFYLLPPLFMNFRTVLELAKIRASLSFWSFDTKPAKFATPVT